MVASSISIGLLKPSLRSAAGYRLYDRANVERLHRIQALRQLGLSLADIGNALSGPQAPLTEVIDKQIAQLDRELAQAARLCERPLALRAQRVSGQSPDLADWLDTLEMMKMFKKYFSPEELRQLWPLSLGQATESGSAAGRPTKSLLRLAHRQDKRQSLDSSFRWNDELRPETGRAAEAALPFTNAPPTHLANRCSTPARSSRSSLLVASMRPCENALISRPCTMAYLPSFTVTG
jgi:DNA-binding transcriptional MerR regulator